MHARLRRPVEARRPAGTVASNPSPTLTSSSPSSATAGSGARRIDLVGSNIIASTIARLNGANLATVIDSATACHATVPAGVADAPGVTSQITLYNPAPGGGTSAPQPYTATYPVPTPSAVSPNSINNRAGQTVVHVTASGVYAATTATVDGAAATIAYVDAAHVDVTLTAAVCSSPGTHQIALANPTPGGGTSTSTVSVTVLHLAPAITGSSPSSVNAGAADTTVTITDSGGSYDAASVVYVGATALSTTYNSATQLTAVVPASMLTTGGSTVTLTVNTPAPGGGTSSSTATLTVNHLAPSLAGASPATIIVGSGNTTETFTGSNYDASSVVYASVNGGTNTALTTTLVSSTQLTAVVPSSMLTATGSIVFTVQTPAPGGGTSGTATVAINNAVASLSSISSTSAQRWEDSGNTRTLTGAGIVSGATVTYGSTSGIATTGVTATSATFVLPASELDDVGTRNVTITNPSSAGPSNALATTVVNPTYLLKYWCPDESVTLNGSNAQVIPNQVSGDTAANYSQLTPSLQPAVVADANYGGRKVVVAAGASAMTSGTFGTPVSQNYTRIFIGEHTSSNTVMLDGADASHRSVFSTVNLNAPTIYAGNTVITATGQTVTRGMWTIHFAGVSSDMRKTSGTALASGNAGAQSCTGVNLFQAIDGTGKATGRMYLDMIASGFLTPTQIAKIAAGYARKTGLALS